ncbi:MAG: hypothetical protein FXF54_04745 [Kosmotoga sp.]|nr:MAG: hypothetical protein FXF54_04745 [Kosmotoga sp.]
MEKHEICIRNLVDKGIIYKHNSKLNKTDETHIKLAEKLNLNKNAYHDLVILRPTRNLLIHLYEKEINETREIRNSLLKFINFEKDNYIVIAKEIKKLYKEKIKTVHEKYFEVTNKEIDITK